MKSLDKKIKELKIKDRMKWSQKDAISYYKNHFFYRVDKMPSYIMLYGPLNSIRLSVSKEETFVEIQNGKIVHVFEKGEILVLDKEL